MISFILLFSSIQNASFSVAPDNTPQDKKQKFDQGFYEKIHDKINAGETREYNVIVYVKKIPVNGEDAKIVAKKNKDKLEDVMIKIHKAKNKYKAQVLSFVSASVPLKEIPRLADYDYVAEIGDGELKVELEMNVARPTVNAMNLLLNGTGVRVAVIDSGIRQNHDDLPVGTKIISQTVCTPTGCGSGNFDDDANHGTHVAGIIASLGNLDSQMKGIASGADLLNTKRVSSGFDTTSVAKALDWSLVNGAKVINASFRVFNNEADTLGICSNNNISNLMVEETVDEGALVIKSAGNQGNHTDGIVKLRTITNPGCGFNVLAVGAINDKNTFPDTNDDIIEDFSSRGSFDGRLKPELVAPGVLINSTDYFTNYSDSGVIGTSFAAPFVSGAAALLLQAQPQYTPLEVKAALLLGANWKAAVPMNATYYENNNSTDSTLNSWIF